MKIDQWKLWTLLALAWFPLVDFLLRKLPLIGSIAGSVWDKLILIFLALLAVRRYLAGDEIERPAYHKVLKVFIALGLAYVVMNASTLSVDFEGFRAVYWYSFFVFILPYVVNEELAQKLVRFSLYCALLISLHGIYQYIVKTPIPSDWVDAAETVRTRVFSVFGSPNIMGSYMVLMFPIAAGKTLASREMKGRLFYGLISFTTLAALLFTYTRGALFALFVALLIVSALIEKRLFFLVILAAVVAFFIPPIQHRVLQLFSGLYWMKSAQSGRIYRWQLTYDIIRHNPLFGAGLGHFGGAVAARKYNTIYVDNYYAKTLAEMGLLGLGMMLALFITVLRNLYSRIFEFLKARRDWPLLVGLYAGILGVLLQCTVENVFEVPAMNFLFWFFVTIALILTRTSNKEVQEA